MIESLSESRLFRDKNFFSRYNVREISDLLMIYLLTLTVFKKEFESLEFARQYAAKTFLNGGYKNWRYSQTDLGAILFFLTSDKGSTISLKAHPSNEAELKRIDIPESEINLFLRRIMNNSDDAGMDNRLLLKIERELRVTDTAYRNLRRVAPYWTELEHDQRKVVITRISQALRRLAPQSEILPMLLEIMKQFDLEIEDAPSKEPDTTISAGKQIAIGTTAGVGTGIAYGLWKAKKKAAERKAGYEFKESQEFAATDETELTEVEMVDWSDSDGGPAQRSYAKWLNNSFDPFIQKGDIRIDSTGGVFPIFRIKTSDGLVGAMTGRQERISLGDDLLDGIQIKGVYIEPAFRKTGVITKIYSALLNVLDFVQSDSAMTPGGLNIWKQLTRTHQVYQTAYSGADIEPVNNLVSGGDQQTFFIFSKEPVIETTDLKSRKFKTKNVRGFTQIDIDPKKFIRVFNLARPDDAVRFDRNRGAFDTELNKYHTKKIARLLRFLSDNPEVDIDLPMIGLGDDQKPVVVDGRHRLHLAAAQNLSSIPVLVRDEDLQKIRSEFGVNEMVETTSSGSISSVSLPIGGFQKPIRRLH